ncbi:TadE/TadG family type IV pilus assembly protein [Mitsuokella sp. WILCCON 0060]|uniref:TadE/TadG family type IV pilus assembly protein n=1 Tax=unclassified Mitsuokella TaxID=2637239 RepID=UPI003F03F875
MKNERGSAVIWTALLTVFVLLLGSAVCYTSWNTKRMAVSYGREAALRLAAEGALEQAARQVEQQPPAAKLAKDIMPKREIKGGYGIITVRVVAVEQEQQAWLIAAAEEKDGDIWQRHKLVRGCLEKREKEGGFVYVWKGRSR